MISFSFGIPAGRTGDAGKDGKDGKDGQDGKDGIDGVPGIDGDTTRVVIAFKSTKRQKDLILLQEVVGIMILILLHILKDGLVVIVILMAMYGCLLLHSLVKVQQQYLGVHL